MSENQEKAPRRRNYVRKSFEPTSEAHRKIVEGAEKIKNGARGLKLVDLMAGKQLLDEGLSEFIAQFTNA